MMQAFDTSKDLAGDVMKWADGGTDRIDADEYLRRVMWDIAQLGGYATGFPVRPIGKVATGLQDAAEIDIPFIRDYEETDFPVRRSLGYSKYVVGEK